MCYEIAQVLVLLECSPLLQNALDSQGTNKPGIRRGEQGVRLYKVGERTRAIATDGNKAEIGNKLAWRGETEGTVADFMPTAKADGLKRPTAD